MCRAAAALPGGIHWEAVFGGGPIEVILPTLYGVLGWRTDSNTGSMPKQFEMLAATLCWERYQNPSWAHAVHFNPGTVRQDIRDVVIVVTIDVLHQNDEAYMDRFLSSPRRDGFHPEFLLVCTGHHQNWGNTRGPVHTNRNSDSIADPHKELACTALRPRL
jgi:hypothetical protein